MKELTIEEKELLLKDLCAKLPYGVILSVTLKDKYDDIVNRNIELTEHNLGYITKASNWREYKPYLRPMSSMTEEEKEEYKKLCLKAEFELATWTKVRWYDTWESIDWLNEHHFDYRGLIEKGLALEAPEGMYETEKREN